MSLETSNLRYLSSEQALGDILLYFVNLLLRNTLIR